MRTIVIANETINGQFYFRSFRLVFDKSLPDILSGNNISVEENETLDCLGDIAYRLCSGTSHR